MRLKWVVLLVLSFPALEAIGIYWLATQIGWWVVVLLVLSGMVGLTLIRMERAVWSMRLLSTLQSGTQLGATLFASGRVCEHFRRMPVCVSMAGGCGNGKRGVPADQDDY